MPVEVIGELAGLQDEVPPEPLGAIIGLIEAEFKQTVTELFLEFDTKPLAAASLAQAHKARLKDDQAVVVKVQRPNIEKIVNIDLAAIGVAIKWLKYYPRRKQTDRFRLVGRRIYHGYAP